LGHPVALAHNEKNEPPLCATVFVVCGVNIQQIQLRTKVVRFSHYLILPAALGLGVYSASNRNEYQKQKNNNVSGK
jgi:hypothetical protein